MGQLGQLARSMLVRQLARLLVWRLARPGNKLLASLMMSQKWHVK
jgi:hypothetical protein